MNDKALKIGHEFEAHVGRVMEKFRTIKGLTQDNMGAEMGISGRTYGKYEKAIIPVKATAMAAVSQICDFDMIEYILFENETVAQKFKGIVKNSRINPYASYDLSSTVRFQNYDYMDGIRMEDQIFKRSNRKHQRKKDILQDYPKTRPLPLCEEDDVMFMEYISAPVNRQKYRILLYGYELLALYDQAYTSKQTSSAFARQLLRQILRDPIEGVDYDIYAYYWKCVYTQL